MRAPGAYHSAILSAVRWRRFSHGGRSVGERPPGRRHTIQLEYRFDRLLSAKLEQVYGLLCPEKRWAVPTTAIQEKLNEQTRGHICTSVVRSTEGESDDRQSDSGPKEVRRKSRVSGAGGMGV